MQGKSGQLILLAAAWLLSACARSAPVAYYQLTSVLVERQTAAATPPMAAVIGIGPLTLPEYLDRPQIVSRLTLNRLQLAERQRWAEPLGDNIARVLQENIAHALDSERVLLYPWSRDHGVERQITIEIIHCEVGDGEVQFEARWTMQDGEGRVLLAQRRNRQRLDVVQPADYDRRVAVLSEALARFSAEIAAAIREMAAEGGDGGGKL